MTKNISVIGLGKLGLTIAACFADKGFNVVGVDINSEKIKKINNSVSPIDETGLDKLLKKVRNNLEATKDYSYAVLNTDISFITVATPSSSDGSFSNRYLENALVKIADALKKKTTYHLVVITSTIMPNTTEKKAVPILEKLSQKKCGRDFGIIYNPAFIALGSIIHDFLNPDFILIGEAKKSDGDKLAAVYKKICKDASFARMNFINAEITKLALNCYITTKITFANSLANICKRIKGADAYKISDSLGLDSRIGTKFLKPGLGYGGPCFPRDTIAFSAFAQKIGVKAKLVEAVDTVNRSQTRMVFNQIKQILNTINKEKKNIRIGFLGLSYKPDTSVVEKSQALDIVKLLVKEGYDIKVYDPQALKNAKNILTNKVSYAKNPQGCLSDVDLGVIAVPWKEFGRINFKKIKKDIILFDCWGVYRKRNLKNVFYRGVNGEYIAR